MVLVLLGLVVSDSLSIPSNIKWLHSDLLDPCFVGVHSESRVGSTSAWTSNTAVLQPFKTIVDPVRRGVYWHKDDPHDFYGEVWTYDQSLIYLRQETFPHWPPPFDPPSAPWDIRPDKFRLFSSGSSAEDLPGGEGRVLAPVKFDLGWNHTGNMSTHLCRNWSGFQAGHCSIFQKNFLDSFVSVKQWQGNFSTTFDGELNDDPRGSFSPAETMRSCKCVRQMCLAFTLTCTNDESTCPLCSAGCASN
jgi:hypothetical protein